MNKPRKPHYSEDAIKVLEEILEEAKQGKLTEQVTKVLFSSDRIRKRVALEQKILIYLTNFKNKHGRMPTCKETFMDCNICHGNLQRVLQRLQSQGKLVRVVRGMNYDIKS